MAAEQDLFFDWNAAHAAPDRLGEALVLDETLRDGIQSPSAVDPRIEEKIEILHLLDELGVVQLDLGLPGAGSPPRAAGEGGGGGERRRAPRERAPRGRSAAGR